MINCLTDSIGLAGCGTQTPVSGLFVNSLPGISLKNFEMLADSEQITGLAVYHDIQIRAQAWLSLEVYSQFSKRYKLATITQSIDTGMGYDYNTTRTAAPEYRGNLYDLDYGNTDNQFIASVLQSHYIQFIRYYSSVVVNGAIIKIFDKDLNTTIQTLTQNLIVGFNIISVNASFSNRRIIIAIDSTTINSVSTPLSSAIRYSNECGARISGGYFNTANSTSTFVVTDDSYGLSVVYGVRCKYDNVICQNPDLFYLPLWYKLGAELMNERLTTDRVNKLTVNRDEAKELKAEYDLQAEEAIAQVVKGIRLDDADCCLECDSNYEIKESPNYY